MNANEIKYRVIDFGDCYSIEKVKFDKEGNISGHTTNKSISVVQKGDFVDPISSLLPEVSQMLRSVKLPIEPAISKGAMKDANKKDNVRSQKASGSSSKK